MHMVPLTFWPTLLLLLFETGFPYVVLAGLELYIRGWP